MNTPSSRFLFFVPSVPAALVKGGPGSGWFGPEHGGNHGPGASGAEPSALPSSAGVTTLEQAEAYWKTHYIGDGQPKAIRCKYGKHTYQIYVTFTRNHAYTEAVTSGKPDEDRVFDPRRAQTMHFIQRVLQHPVAVSWSATMPTNKQFDGVLTMADPRYGRVILKPTPAADDIAKKQITHFEFVSWHLPDAMQHQAAKTAAQRWVTPTQMKKADCTSTLFPPLDHRPEQGKAGRLQKGVPFNSVCPLCEGDKDLYGTRSNASDGFTENRRNFTPLILFFKAPALIEPLLKRMATPAGARWITVRPNGADAKGVPVLIQESQPGSGVYHVIGGAKGKLNYLKLRGIKPESEYKQQAAEKRKLRQEEAKRQRDRDREAGLETSKKKEKEAVAAVQRDEERQFIAAVAQKAGWTEKDLAFDHEQHAHLSPRAYQEVRNQHHRAILKQATTFVDEQVAQMLADPAQLKQALGEVPLTAPKDPAVLTVNDLDPVKPPDTGRGFAPTYRQRAEGGQAAVQAEAAQIQQERLDAHPERKAALDTRKATRDQLKQELETQRPPEPPPRPTETLPVAEVMDLLKQKKQLQKQLQKTQQARQQIDAAATLNEIKAYNLEVGGQPIEDDEIVQDLEDALRTTQTRALLAEAEKVSAGQSPEQALSRHLGAGAQAAVDALALTVAGQGLIDRSVVDVLGMEGAARAIAHRLHATLAANEMETLQQALGDYHIDHYTRHGEQALKEAQAYQDDAAQIELDAAKNGADLQQAQALNRRRVQALANARRVLGTCLGEFEMNAALITALKAGQTGKPLEVALGKISLESAVAQVKALGLQTSDYTLDSLGGVQFLTVRPEGLDRLTQPIDADHLRRQRAALDILSGRRDEDPWLPQGIAHRPDLAAPTPPGVAPRLAEPFAPSGPDDLRRALEDYIGGRTADGDAPADILSDLLAQPTIERAEAAGATRDQYRAVVNALAPSRNAQGKLLRAEAHAEPFQRLADQFVQRRYGGDRSPLHRQDVPMDATAIEALHRALSAEPAGIAAFKAIGDLTDDDQRALRAFFAQRVAKEDPAAADLRQTVQAHEKQEPERETTDLFGETGVNPAWSDWQNRRNDLAEQLNAMTLGWPDYVKVMHGRKNAYAAMQDLIRSRVTEQFCQAYNTLRPQAPLKLGRQVIRGNLNHLDAIDPEARAARLSQERQLIDSLRNRVGGQYAAGSVIEKLDVAREQQEAMAQNQMGFFGAAEEPTHAPPPPLKADERHTLGHVVEQRLAAMLGVVGQNFKPGQAIRLWNPSMSGPDHVGRQRAIKLIETNRRVALGLGTGTGKSLVMLSAFTDLHAKNQAHRAVFAVPSVSVGQLHAEALRYLEPGKYQWHAEPGASREERIAALKDPANHFVVTTHQSLRDDLLYLGAQHEGITPEQLADRLDRQTPQARAAWMKGLLAREGIDSDYLAVDEFHNLLNRQGKDNSRMANVLDALGANTRHLVLASADPIKNSVDEAHDVLSKLDPARYADRAAFMRRYGVNTAAAQQALQREMLPYMITGRIESGQAVQRQTETVPLSAAQRRDLDQVSRQLANLRLARMKGAVDVEAARALAPDAFAQVPASEHPTIARQLARSIGVLREAAINRILNAHPEGGKLDAIDRLVNPGGALHGQPGIIFTHSLHTVQHLADRLKRAGHRVVALTGGDSSPIKDKKKLMFNPEVGPAQADILVTSDAGAVAMNAQRGRWLIQHDTPQTAMVHNQRNGRVDRVGQQHDVQLIDLIHDHPAERAARDRLAKKYELREIMTAPQVGLDDTGLAGFLARRRAEAPEAATEEPLFKAVFKDQPGYDLREGPKGKNRWLREDGGAGLEAIEDAGNERRFYSAAAHTPSVVETFDMRSDDVLTEFGQRLVSAHPEWFPRGLRSLTAKPMGEGYAETLGVDQIILSSTDDEHPGFIPARELTQALAKIKARQPLEFAEEYAVEILWHEINHLQATGLARSNRLVETAIQLVSRHTYPDLLRALGGAPSHQAAIIEGGYAYTVWVANFRALLAKHRVVESDAVAALASLLKSATDETLGPDIAKWLADQGGGKTSQWRKALSQLDLTSSDFLRYVGRLWFRGYSTSGNRAS